eukprot:s1468_g6.t1
MGHRLQQDTEASLSADWGGSTECNYVPPQEAGEMGYEGMEKLTSESWTAESGDADGKHVLCYAYGPAFAKYEKGQVGARKYNEETSMIEFWYSKSHWQRTSQRPEQEVEPVGKSKCNHDLCAREQVPRRVVPDLRQFRRFHPEAPRQSLGFGAEWADSGSHLCVRHQQSHSQVSFVKVTAPEGMKAAAQEKAQSSETIRQKSAASMCKGYVLDARREAEVRQLLEQPNWRELEPSDDDEEDWQPTDIEEWDFRLFDLMEDDPTEQSGS